jgi:hypothetical protein
MPWWMSRLAWRFRRKRLVRVHLATGDAHPDTPDTLEGVRLGVWGGHYVLMLGKVVEERGATPLAGVLEVPRDRVLFVQVMS